jgi:hypothetical protein
MSGFADGGKKGITKPRKDESPKTTMKSDTH